MNLHSMFQTFLLIVVITLALTVISLSALAIHIVIKLIQDK